MICIAGESPLCSPVESSECPDNQARWNGCLTRAELNVEGLTLGQVLAQMQVFLTLSTRAAAHGETVGSRWLAGGI